MSWDIFPKDKIEYFLEKLKAKLDGKADSGEVEGLKTVTGNPITLTDSSETYAQGLSVELEPIQDLHGYDFPWVGGAGKNKLPMTVANIKAANTEGTWNGNVYTINGGTFTILTDDGGNVMGIKENGTFSAYTDFLLATNISIQSGEYTLSSETGLTVSNQLYVKYGEAVRGTNDDNRLTITGAPTTIWIYVWNGTSLDNVTVKPQLEVGNQATTFAPYSNICPISGYTECNVNGVGDNLYVGSPSFDEYESLSGNWSLQTEKYNGHDVYKRSDVWGGCYKSINLPVGTYTFSVMAKTNDGGRIYLYPLLENVTTGICTPFQAYFDTSTDWHRYYYSFEVTTSGTFAFRVERATSGDVYISEYQLEKGTTTPTDYHPYQFRTASVTFGQTVYGGVSDFVEGGTEDDRASVDLSSLTWTKDGNDFLSSELSVLMKRPSSVSEVANMLCECFDVKSQSNFETKNGSIAYFYTNSSESVSKVVVYLTDTSLQDFMTIVNGQKLVYQKATPTTIATPPTDLKLLENTNNLTTNGTTITLDYIPNNSIGDAVKASEEYTDRAVETKGGVQKTVIFDDLVRIADEITLSLPSSYNFIVFEVNYMYDGATGSAIYSSLIDSINIPANYSGTSHWMELRKAGDIVSVRGDTDIDQGGALLKITVF